MTLTDIFLKIRITILLLLLLLVSLSPLSAQTGSVDAKGYGKASYNTAQAGTYMRNWLVAGPVFVTTEKSDPTEEVQLKSFKTDLISTVNVQDKATITPLMVKQQPLKWTAVSSEQDIVDLDKFYNSKDYAYAYALSEIKSDAAKQIILSVGSDDGVRIWHNGKLVHDNWAPRGVNKDDDLVPLQLVKGSNQILLKVQDMEGGWGFVTRILDKVALADEMNRAAASGNIEKINMLLSGGADVNTANKSGITPIMMAKLAGRDAVIDMLLKKGAANKTVPPATVIADALYNSLEGKLAPGIAVLVAREGDILYRKGFGYADIQNKTVVEPDTKFRIGSVTKQFTAAAILKLQEQNLLSVTDKLSKYIPDFPRGDEVTIHHLLTHTSGIHSYTNKPDFIDRVVKTITTDSLIAYFKSDPYDFNPGERMLYNNSGYILLGYIIEKVSGKSYDRYLQETFFQPLGMTNTGIHYSGIKLAKEAKGYTRQGDTHNLAANWDMSWAGGAGAIYSTLDDLLKWNQALYSAKVINKNSLDAALTPAVLTTGAQPSMNYGYGLSISKYRGMPIVVHGGGLQGFITQLAYYPTEKISVVMFSNSDNPEVNFDFNRVVEPFIWDKLGKQESFAAAEKMPENLTIYTGRFEIANMGVLTISAENNKLFAHISGQGKFEIFPSTSTDEFFWKVVEARIKFKRNPNGEVNEGMILQNGQETRVSRLPDVTTIQVDPAILDRYTGRYKVNENVTVVVSKENNKLYAEPTGQPKMELLPTAESTFIIKEINAKLVFIKNESEKISKIRLSMNGMDSDLIRLD